MAHTGYSPRESPLQGSGASVANRIPNLAHAAPFRDTMLFRHWRAVECDRNCWIFRVIEWIKIFCVVSKFERNCKMLSLGHILKYLDAGAEQMAERSRRCIVEGESIVNSNHLLRYGLKAEAPSQVLRLIIA